MSELKILLGVALLLAAPLAVASPEVTLGKPESYCVTHCYIRIPFSISNFPSAHQTGMVFCDIEAEISSALPVYEGQVKTRTMRGSPIGVYKNDKGLITGGVELETGIRKEDFKGAQVKSARCHL